MNTLIVGAGALGGLIAARLIAANQTVALAVRDERTAAHLRKVGLRVSDVGGALHVPLANCDALQRYPSKSHFDLVLLATKAPEAIELAASLINRLAPDGCLLPIQNGGVAQSIAESTRDERIIGGLSNIGATRHAPGDYEQSNAGHLLIGEIAGGESPRIKAVADWLRAGVAVRRTDNYPGAVWSKLLVNCAVTTIGAIAGCTLREYLRHPVGRALFDAAYDEALAIALGCGIQPEAMLVDPIPPGWEQGKRTGPTRDAWLADMLSGYGDAKPSMLQDFERGRPTEVDFINGYVARVGDEHDIPAPVNTAITTMVQSISAGQRQPALARLSEAAALAGLETC